MCDLVIKSEKRVKTMENGGDLLGKSYFIENILYNKREKK